MSTIAFISISFLWLIPEALIAQASEITTEEIQETDHQKLFLEATRQYDEGNFEEAGKRYLKIVELGWENGPLYYNMGNTFFRLNDLGQAVLFYERAARLMPGDEALAHSIRVAKAKTANRFRLLPKPFGLRAWNKLVFAVQPSGLLYIGLLLYLVGISFLIYRIWLGYRQEWIRRIWSWSLVAGIILLTMAYAASWTLSNQRSAVVVDTKTPFFQDPGDLSQSELEIHEGLTVDLLSDREGLYEVRLPDGQTGWISASSIVEI